MNESQIVEKIALQIYAKAEVMIQDDEEYNLNAFECWQFFYKGFADGLAGSHTETDQVLKLADENGDYTYPQDGTERFRLRKKAESLLRNQEWLDKNIPNYDKRVLPGPINDS